MHVCVCAYVCVFVWESDGCEQYNIHYGRKTLYV